MPTKARKQREAQRAAVMANIPDHIKKRIEERKVRNERSTIISALGTYNLRGGLATINEDGYCILSQNIGKGGNEAHHKDALDAAKALKSQHSDIWGEPKMAKSISLSSGVPLSTVYRYLKLIN